MNEEQVLFDLKEGRLLENFENKRALLVGVYRSTKEKEKSVQQLQELKSLGDTFGVETVLLMPCPIKKFDTATYLGKGKVEEIAFLCKEEDIGLVIFDDEISPHQQRNLEKIFQRIVVDRTELILGVFFKHAKTKEAKLQIALAHLRYQFPRLKRMWTHLSRQRTGGAKGGHLKGEGERQIEIDRQILKNKITKLEKKIEQVKKHREIQRTQREKTKIPTFAIIGYTNAGKSTLLNALTKANILVEDKLFATLDTTTRKYVLPNNQEILLIDTVGFIRKLPHTLVAAFRSTLEEVVYADILLHIIDVSNPQAEEQAQASIEVLKELKAEKKPILTILNKIDENEDQKIILKLKVKYPKTVEISALKGTGLKDLIQMLIQEISQLRSFVKLKIPQSHYAIVSLIREKGRIKAQEYEDNYILIEAEIPQELKYKVEPFILL